MDTRIILIAAFLLLAGCMAAGQTKGETKTPYGADSVDGGKAQPSADNTTTNASTQPNATEPQSATTNATNKTPAKGEGTIVDVGGSIPIQAG